MSDRRIIRRVPMLRDLDASEQAALRRAADLIRDAFARRGYTTIETPLLEETELFLRKSGGDLTSRLYAFAEPGGHQVSLRPEYTAPVLRHVIEQGLVDSGSPAPLPLRYQYCGTVFRYPGASEEQATPRAAFTQCGAELIGPAGPRADAEVLAMAWTGARDLGVPDPQLLLGDVALVLNVLGPVIRAPRARMFLASTVSRLGSRELTCDEVVDRAESLGLLESEDGGIDEAVEPSVDTVRSVLRLTAGSEEASIPGGRSSEEIMRRLASKLSARDTRSAVRDAAGLLASLASIRDTPEAAIAEGKRILKRAGLSDAAFRGLEETVEAVVDEGVPRDAIRVDLGLARGIAYYTGMVFALVSVRDETELGGGGRYDGLLRILGADRDVPALGFAFDLEAVLKTVSRSPATRPERKVVVAPRDAVSAAAAARRAGSLREAGVVALLEVERRSEAAVRRYAGSVGASSIEYVSADGGVRREAVR